MMTFLAQAGSQRKDVLEWVRKQEALSNRWKRDDPETLFDDDSTLGFDPASLAYSPYETFTTNCGSFISFDFSLLGQPYSPRSQACPW